MKLKITELDPALKPYESDLQLRMDNYNNTKKALLHKGQKLIDIANGHMYYGFHQTDDGWS